MKRKYGKNDGAEWKVIEFITPGTFTYVFTGGTASPTINMTQSIPQGVGLGQRIGNKITLKNIKLTVTSDMADAALAINTVNLRIIAIMWSNKNSAPVLSDVLANITSNIALMTSPLNRNTSEFYRCIVDKKIVQIWGTPTQNVVWEYNKRCSIPLEWDDINGPKSNQIYFWIVGDQPATSLSLQTGSIAYRVWWTDC